MPLPLSRDRDRDHDRDHDHEYMVPDMVPDMVPGRGELSALTPTPLLSTGEGSNCPCPFPTTMDMVPGRGQKTALLSCKNFLTPAARASLGEWKQTCLDYHTWPNLDKTGQ